jgi:hypothetical protein
MNRCAPKKKMMAFKKMEKERCEKKESLFDDDCDDDFLGEEILIK